MSIQAATPYLILGGKARDAIALYERAFDAKIHAIQRFGDIDGSCAEAQRDLVMHAELRLDGATIMLSDGPGNEVGAISSAGEAKVSVAIAANEEAPARRAFDVLAEKGRVIQPLFAAPWGGLFGVVRDQHDVAWMFNIVAQDAAP